MNDQTIEMHLISSEERPHVNNQSNENLIRNNVNSNKTNNTNNKTKQPADDSEYSWWATHQTKILAVCIFVLFTIITIFIGTMIVCLVRPEQPSKTCTFVVKSIIYNSISNDSHPHSIAIGDFNNDGLPDIVVPNSGMNNIGVFIRLADGTFTDQITYSTGYDSIPYGVVVADINNDQQLDIVVANFGSHNIVIFSGNGNGTFKLETTFSTGSSRPRWIAVGDFNNDVKLDIVVINYGTNNIGIFLQDNNGSFAKQITSSTGYDSDSYSLAVADLNNDNKLDIVVANYGTDNIGVLLGYGNGRFRIQSTFTTGINSHPYSIAIDHLNNDTYLDIVVACSGTNNVGVLLGYGNGTFTIPTQYFIGNNFLPRSVAIADLDNDNKLDITVANYGNASIFILFGDGNGSFSDQYRNFFTSPNFNPYSFAIADFNIDNLSDIAVVNYDFNYVDIILNYRIYSFSDPTIYTTNNDSDPTSVVVADLNNDDQLDIVVINTGDDNVGIYLGHGNGMFSSQTTYSTWAGSGPCSAAIGDFNNDSRLDIVATNCGAHNIGVFLGYGNGTFLNQTIFSTGNNSYPRALAVGDFNNDSRPDIVVANFWTSSVSVFLGYGNGTFASQTAYPSESGLQPTSIIAGDFNNDDRLDIVITSYATDIVSILLGYGNGTFFKQTAFSTKRGTESYNTAVGDLNNDGQLDLIVTLYLAADIIVFLGYGNGTFSPAFVYSAGSASKPFACAFGDVNSDNRLDIVVSDAYLGNVAILLGDGNGSFFDTKIYSTGRGSFVTSIALGDFNNDRVLDIVVANNITNTISVFLGFTEITGVREAVYSTGSSPHPRAVAVIDFNNDSQSDIVIANYGLNSVEVLLQNTDQTFAMPTIFSTGALSLPSSVAVGDFNNDSESDIIVANSGSKNIGVLYGYGNGNFTSQTTYSNGLDFSPKSVVVGYFNNDERLDIAIADSGTDSVLTLLRYDIGALGNQTVYLKGTSSSPMSVATADLNKDGWLDFVVTNGIYNNVGVFIGLGDGTFSNETRYSTGNRTVPWCIAIDDFNQDNHLDIVVGNYFGGTIGIFLGFGDGTFSNQTTYPTDPTNINSGPKAIAIGHFNKDRRLDIVIANYGSSNIGIFLAYDNGTFSNVITYSTGSGSVPYSITVGDLNNDDQLDIIVTLPGAGGLGIFLGYGNGNFSAMISLLIGDHSAPASIITGDFNNDNRLDIVVALGAINSILVLLGNGNGTFFSPTTYPTGDGSQPYFLVSDDFNNDNQLDIAIANQGTNSLGILLGFVNGTFFSQLSYYIGDSSQPLAIVVGDFNNDSRLDIVIANYGANNVEIFFGYANESFLFAPTYSTGSLSQPNSIAVGDFNNDTRLDVVVANNGTNNIMVLFGSGYGNFISHTLYSTGDDSYPCWVAVGDFNNDSRLDIVVANSGTNNIGIFLSNGTGTFSSQMTYSTGLDSQPYSVAVLDFDNDTRLDIAVANYASNSICVFFGNGNGSFTNQSIFNTGFNSRPFALAVGDVNKDNLTDIIVTNNEYGNVDILLKEC